MNSRATLVSPISVPLYTVISVYTEIYRRSSEGGKGKVAPPPPRISGGPREGEAMTGRRTRSSIPFVQLGATSSRGTRSAQAFSRARSPAAAAKRLRRAPQTAAAAPAPCGEGWLSPGRAPVRATGGACSNEVIFQHRATRRRRSRWRSAESHHWLRELHSRAPEEFAIAVYLQLSFLLLLHPSL